MPQNKSSPKPKLQWLDIALRISEQVLLHEDKNSNVVFSPLSINILLGMIAAGSGGKTLSQSLQLFGCKTVEELNALCSNLISIVVGDSDSGRDGPLLSFASGAWIDQSVSLKDYFKQVLNTLYKAALNHADFQTNANGVTKEVNLWAEKETNGLIKQVLPPGFANTSTRLILANALYFKGCWTHQFDKSVTEDRDFYLLNGSSIQVPFMTSDASQQVSAFKGFKVLRLPYKPGGDKHCFSMYLFLPDKVDGLEALTKKVTTESGFLQRHLPTEEAELGKFWIPKFKISFGFEVSDAAKALGLDLPFVRGGLTEMANGEGLFVTSIVHKSFIEVSEEGTEAAAVSVCDVGFCCFDDEPDEVDFVADHPFLFVIREDTTGVVLFIGRMVDLSVD